jgi:integrase
MRKLETKIVSKKPKAECLSDPKVKEWFELIGNKRTIENYSYEFPRFMDFVKSTTEIKTPSQIIDTRIDQSLNRDQNVKRFWETVGIKYMHSLENQSIRLNTIKSYLRTMLSFFSKNHVPLTYSRGELIGSIEPSEKDKVIREWIPSNEDVRLLYRLANTARDRAILLTLYQSGFSEVDTANMKIEDFEFYDTNGNWKIALNEDLYTARLREKTNILQQTCVSREALEETRIMLQSRGFPKQGYLFVSFRNEQLGVRGINEAMKSIVAKAYNGKSELWKTKHLRDAFMNALEKARIPTELKDAFVGHMRQGARKEYGISEDTIKSLYAEAFKFLTVNGFGSTSRKVEEIETKFTKTTSELAETIAQMSIENKTLKEGFDMLKSSFDLLLTQYGKDADEKIKSPEFQKSIEKLKREVKHA